MRIFSHLLKKSSMESFAFCAVQPLAEIVQQGLVAKSYIVFLLLWQVENLQMS